MINQHILKPQKYLQRLIFGLVIGGILVFATAFAHAYHTSITKIDYNAKEHSLEISMRVFTDDLESVLSHQNNKQIFKVENNDKNDIAIERYVRKCFRFSNNKNQAIDYQYIGKENEGEATWVYLEIPFNENIVGTKLQQNVLLDFFSDQVNIVNVTYKGDRKSYVFKAKETLHELE